MSIPPVSVSLERQRDSAFRPVPQSTKRSHTSRLDSIAGALSIFAEHGSSYLVH